MQHIHSIRVGHRRVSVSEREPVPLADPTVFSDGTPVVEPTEDDEYGWAPSPADEEFAHAVHEAREQIGGKGPDDGQPSWIVDRFPTLDWEAAYKTDFSKIDWLPGRFAERGQQIAFVGDGKAGKSLFIQDWAWRCASGRAFMGDPRHEPLRVLYFDRENSLRDITTRAQAFGATPADLANLIYKPFPTFDGSLDQSEKAGKELVYLAVEVYKVDIVILDTVSRFISGKESDSDTWLALYDKVHAKLKAKGITCIRLDHFGKDAERGSRGSSAKSQDVDSVWELTAIKPEKGVEGDVETIVTTLKLTRTHTRTGLGEDAFAITRRGKRMRGGMWLPGQTKHELTDRGILAEAKREIDVVVDELLAAGVPKIRGRGDLTTWLKANGRKAGKTEILADVVKELKARQDAA